MLTFYAKNTFGDTTDTPLIDIELSYLFDSVRFSVIFTRGSDNDRLNSICTRNTNIIIYRLISKLHTSVWTDYFLNIETKCWGNFRKEIL